MMKIRYNKIYKIYSMQTKSPPASSFFFRLPSSFFVVWNIKMASFVTISMLELLFCYHRIMLWVRIFLV